MRKQAIVAVLTLTGVVAFSSQAMASSADSAKPDPLVAGFEAFAKDNPLMADAVKSYLQDLKKAEQEKPELKKQ